jgi:hypothetical protein|tara:strand:+ start:526 stop:690 length:165 start_codon:yes stop_codon:yes gene_type:complete
MLEDLEFIEELKQLIPPKSGDFIAKQQIISLIDKYQNKADETERRNFNQYHGEE